MNTPSFFNRSLFLACAGAHLLLAAPMAQGQFIYITNNGAITITGYTGPGGAVNIPATINALPVTSIGDFAFADNTNLTRVTIPNSVISLGDHAFDACASLTKVTIENGVTSIGSDAFGLCISLTSVTMGNSVTSIGNGAFGDCISLTNITIPNSVTNIGDSAFVGCRGLTSVTMGNSVTGIGDSAFWNCNTLTTIFFMGNAPTADAQAFSGFFSVDPVTVYYLANTIGWSNTFAGRPTALWLPQVQTSDASFGVRTNQFGFNIAWASGQTVVVEACSNLTNPVWTPVATNTLTSGTSYFSDPQWTNYPTRFYRVRSP